MWWIVLTLTACGGKEERAPYVVDTAPSEEELAMRAACEAACDHRYADAGACQTATTDELLPACYDDCSFNAERWLTTCPLDAHAWFTCVASTDWFCPQGSEEPVKLDDTACTTEQGTFEAC